MRLRNFALAAVSIVSIFTLCGPVFAQTSDASTSIAPGPVGAGVGPNGTCIVDGQTVPCGGTTAPTPAPATTKTTATGTAVSPSVQPSPVGTTTCKLNGQVVPCDELAKGASMAIGTALGFIVFWIVLLLAGSVFWLMMLIHAATHPIENRALWIIVIVVFSFLGAIVYYFAVKRPYAKMLKAGGAAPAAAADAAAAVSPIAPPVSPQLAEYVRTSRQQGVADDATRASLVAAGWNATDVDRALRG